MARAQLKTTVGLLTGHFPVRYFFIYVANVIALVFLTQNQIRIVYSIQTTTPLLPNYSMILLQF